MLSVYMDSMTLPTEVQCCVLPCRKEAWSIKMNDSILDIKVGEDCNIYAALADGFIAVLQVPVSCCELQCV